MADLRKNKVALALVACLVLGLAAGVLFWRAPARPPARVFVPAEAAAPEVAPERVVTMPPTAVVIEAGGLETAALPAVRPLEDRPAEAADADRASEGFTPEEVRELLLSDDPLDLVRGLRAISRLGDDGAAVALARGILENKKQVPMVLTSALRALAQIGGPAAAEAIATALRGEPAWLASSAARSLGEMGESTAIPALRAAFPDSDPRLQLDIALALRQLGDPEPASEVARDALAGMAAAESGTRAAAVRTLSMLRDPAHNAFLVQSLTDQSSDVRQTAAGALAQQGTEADLPALQALLSDSAPQVVSAARRAIHFIEHPEERGTATRSW